MSSSLMTSSFTTAAIRIDSCAAAGATGAAGIRPATVASRATHRKTCRKVVIIVFRVIAYPSRRLERYVDAAKVLEVDREEERKVSFGFLGFTGGGIGAGEGQLEA